MTSSSFKVPQFCGNYECPEFQNLSSPAVEIREYSPSVWVTTPEKGDDIASKYSSFERLYNYIQGENKIGSKIPMTVPVIVKYDVVEKVPKEMGFFLPKKLHESPPLPTSSFLEVETFPALQVFVSSFGGFATHSVIFKEYQQLMSSLAANPKYKNSYETNKFIYAGYNSPFTLFNRHNEIWIIKTQ